MFKLMKTNATLYFANEEEDLRYAGELYRLEDGRLMSYEGRLPETLDNYEADMKRSLWVFEIEGELRYADDQAEAVAEIADWLAEHPRKAAEIFAK